MQHVRSALIGPWSFPLGSSVLTNKKNFIVQSEVGKGTWRMGGGSQLQQQYVAPSPSI